MKVQGSALFQEMQAMAKEVQGASGAPNGLGMNPTGRIEGNSQSQFGDLLTNAINNVNELQQISKQKVTALENGDRSVSLAEVMIASQKSSVAFEATVQVRNKLVEAYKDIMNMPV